MHLSKAAFAWLQEQVDKLGNIIITKEELGFLRKECAYLDEAHLTYLRGFRLRPKDQVTLEFSPIDVTECGDLHIKVKGLWVETILYEIPILALTSEAYFKFVNKDWNHDGQEEKAYKKAKTLLENGCIVSDFGSRRRRDYKTQDLVMRGLVRASREGGVKGKLTGTSNVHFAMMHGIAPVGTVAHEWYMGIAAITNNYESANELGLRYWVGCFGEGVLGIALTDTFGTPAFFRAFQQPIVSITSASRGSVATLPSTATSSTASHSQSLADTTAPVITPLKGSGQPCGPKSRTYAEAFTGIRQDSGDPKDYVRQARDFYDSVGIKDKKVIIFSDSLNVERCLEYRRVAEEAGFAPSFGVGTFFTNDFVHKSDGKKSVPLNIVIKISHADGRPAVKISDNIGKNTGDSETVKQVKERLGYVEKDWAKGDEATRWGKEGQ